jgi:hypothetical protein
VAASLRKVFDKWQGDEYKPAEVYELLHPIVFPASRPADILLFADSSKLRDAQVVSLGATLVNWARRAEKLPDLAERIAARKKNPQSLIPALVLETLIDLEQDETDSANAHLVELSQAVEKGALPQQVQLACHAAIPAAATPELKEPAFKILQVAVRQETQSNPNSEETSLGELVAMVNEHLASEPNKVKEFFETFLVGRQANYARYGGDYGQYLQWRDWAGVAEQAAKASVPAVALDFMGRVTDFRYQNYGRPSLTVSLAAVCRDLRGRSPKERYEAWRDWTLPAEGRQSVRLLAEWIEPVTVPSTFLPKDQAIQFGQSDFLLCNFHELLDAAADAGTFDELRERARTAWEQKLPGADFLWALVLIRAGDSSALQPVLAELKKTLPDRTKREPNQPAPDWWGDYLIYRECMQSPEFGRVYGPPGHDLQTALHSQYQFQAIAHLEYDYLVRSALDTGAKIRPGDPSGLQHWLAVSPRELTTSSKPSWVVHDNQVAHLPGPGTDTLLFAYPVTGDFQFSFDSYHGEWAETDAGYGGIILETWSGAVANSIAGHESIRHPATLRRDGFNRIDIRVAGGKMKFFVNNHLAYEEDASPTSPWLMLYTHGARVTNFRRISLTGNPVIPREVQLFADDRMDGWNCTFFRESQPRLRLMAAKPEDENDRIYRDQQQEPAEHDWKVQNSELLGNPKADLVEYAQSWLYYHRPLCDGESFQYEFFHVPGSSAAFPSVGRLAFLLEPAGVDLHWIGREEWDEAVLGIPEDNRVAESECRRGPAELPLRSNDWNKVAVTLQGDSVVIKLNDVEVYERVMEPENHRLFGIYRDKRQAAKVRSAVLAGPWPDEITPELQNTLLASDVQHSDADRRLITGMLRDVFAEHDLQDVVAKARSLSADERRELLEQWVLPSADHANFRLYYRRANADSAAHDGIISPAVELVEIAASQGELPQLRERIDQLATESNVDERCKQALLAIIDIKLGDDQSARESLAAVHESISKGLPKDTPRRDRAAEILAAWCAAERPALCHVALDLARRLRDVERDKETTSGDSTWGSEIDMLVGRAESAVASQEQGETVASTAPPDGWIVLADRNPSQQFRGVRHSRWDATRGIAWHRPGGAVTRLIFQSPLAGKFEIQGELSVDQFGEAALAYGGHAAAPQHDLKAKRVLTLPQSTRDVPQDLSIPDWASTANFRIAVDGTKVTTFVNDVQIHEEFVTPQPNPWLVLQALAPGNACTVRNVRILGTPEIPESIDLVETFSTAFWRADLYDESVVADGDENSVWRRAGEEIVGQLRKDRAAKPLEGVLAYQRPLLEDGTIEFESYYVPGEFEVHPAVGRHAIVVRPQGVVLHTLTGAQWSADDMRPDNEQPIDGAAESVPLRENDWNQFKLQLAGDRLTLSVNGQEAASITLTEPAAGRFFGLFRYVDSAKCRVRKLVYRGEWPKQIPSVEQQGLAAGGPPGL